MKILLPLLLASLAISACAPSTPQARIARYPEKFAALSKKDQGLVQEGQIARGMSPDAVMFAWGFPDQQFEGSRDSRQTARWDYATAVPVYGPTYFYGGYGYGRYGPYSRRGYSNFGFALGPDIAYVPSRVASVWFIDHRVDAWERVR